MKEQQSFYKLFDVCHSIQIDNKFAKLKYLSALIVKCVQVNYPLTTSRFCWHFLITLGRSSDAYYTPFFRQHLMTKIPFFTVQWLKHFNSLETVFK